MSNQKEIVTVTFSFDGCAGDSIDVESVDEVIDILDGFKSNTPNTEPDLIQFSSYEEPDRMIHQFRLHDGVDPRPEVEAAFEVEPIEEEAEPGETPVIFRRWVVEEDAIGDGVIALFPTHPSDSMSWLNMDSYERIGQHGSADYGVVTRNSRPATPDEYANLKRELEGQGYENLKAFQCEHAIFQKVRKEVFQNRRQWGAVMFRFG